MKKASTVRFILQKARRKITVNTQGLTVNFGAIMSCVGKMPANVGMTGKMFTECPQSKELRA